MVSKSPQTDHIAHAGLAPDAFIGQMTALARELEAKCNNQAERIRHLEGATNHAGGTPLSQWRECAEFLAKRLQYWIEREADWAVDDENAMHQFLKLKEASK